MGNTALIVVAIAAAVVGIVVIAMFLVGPRR
jgi:hypothetical protein